MQGEGLTLRQVLLGAVRFLLQTRWWCRGNRGGGAERGGRRDGLVERETEDWRLSNVRTLRSNIMNRETRYSYVSKSQRAPPGAYITSIVGTTLGIYLWSVTDLTTWHTHYYHGQTFHLLLVFILDITTSPFGTPTSPNPPLCKIATNNGVP